MTDNLVLVPCKGFDIWLPSNHFTTRTLLRDRTWEPDVESIMWDKKPAVFVDVGAQFGYYTVMASTWGATVIAIEPRQSCVSVIEENISRLGLDSIHIVQEMVLGPDMYGVIDDTGNFQYGDDQTKTLDDIVSETRLFPDLVKIDVEGCEYDVLSGAIGILMVARPDLVIEVHPNKIEKLGNTVGGMFTLLSNYCYQYKALNPLFPMQHIFCTRESNAQRPDQS